MELNNDLGGLTGSYILMNSIFYLLAFLIFVNSIQNMTFLHWRTSSYQNNSSSIHYCILLMSSHKTQYIPPPPANSSVMGGP